MSSVPDKPLTSTIVEKRGFFLRTSSIKKIKCSATYPFRLAGTKFNRDAIKLLFQTLIIKARIISHKAFIDLLIATFKLVGVLMTLWIGASTKKICDTEKKTESVLGFHERLIEKIHKLQKHKQRFEKNTKDLSSSSSTSEILNLFTNKLFNNDKSKFYYQNDSIKLKKLNLKNHKIEYNNNSNLKIQSQNAVSSSSTSSSLNEIYEPKKNYILVVLVYASEIIIYLQLLILTVALNTTENLPPGLLFLITSLFLIAIIVFKVFLIEKNDKNDEKFVGKQVEKNSVDEQSSSSSSSTTTTTDTRPTRSKLRKISMIDFKTTTISKIKIL